MRGKGFTLVELLVTVSILAILMAIGLISFNNIQKSSRDAKRKSDISTIQSALEQYHTDQGYYPILGTACTNGVLFFSSTGCALNDPATGTKIYMSKVPQEAKSTTLYSYIPNNSAGAACTNTIGTPASYCTNYCLQSIVENTSNAVLAGSPCSATASRYQTRAP